jgi:hypothetical protein
MAVGALMEQPDQLGRRLVPRKTRRQIGRDRRLAQQLQPQFRALPVQRQILFDGLQGMPMDGHLHRAIRANEQEPGGLPPLRQPGYEVQRGMIAPVQVFENEHQRTLCRDGIHRLGQLAQHAFPGRPHRPVL